MSEREQKIKRGAVAVAAIGALGLGGAGIAAAASGGTGGGTAVAEQSEATESPENQAAEGPETGEGAEDSESGEGSLTGPDAEKAKAAAEQATGGKALEVSRDNEAAEKDSGADDGPGGEQGFQSPQNAAYEVEVDTGGQEVDVYLDKDFQVLDTQAGEGQDD